MSPRMENHLDDHVWVAMRHFDTERSAPRPAVVHDHATLALYLAGRMTFWMQGHYEVTAGDLLLVPAGVPHYVVHAEDAAALGVSVCLPCAPNNVRDTLMATYDDVRGGGCAVRRVAAPDREHVEQTLRGLDAELQRSDAGDRDLAVGAYVALLAVAVQRAGPGKVSRRASPNPVVAEALAYVHRHARRGISLRDVAAQVSRSPAHLAAVVKQTTGETVVGWITRARLAESRQLLASTDATIEVVAERCGFQSPSHFHRAFKRAHGVAPGAWRRGHR